jgi:hypothetical protein
MTRLLASLALFLAGSAAATPWTYEGSLADGGQAAQGRYDLRLSLVDAHGERLLADPVVFSDVAVDDGRFRIAVDFGIDPAQWPGARLKTEVQRGSGGFIALDRLQAVVAGGPPAAACWGLDGNAGTASATNFIGTTDMAPLVLATAGARSAQFTPSARLFDGLPISVNIVAGAAANAVSSDARGVTVRGGGSNGPDPQFSTANQTGLNQATDHYATASGGAANQAGSNDGEPASGRFAVVGGGVGNFSNGAVAAVGGGRNNRALGIESVVAGGRANLATATQGTVIGGRMNRADGVAVTVGGSSNFAAGPASAVLGGLSVLALAERAAIAGGQDVGGFSEAAVPGGTLNCAGGKGSLAAGTQAKIRKPVAAANSIGCHGGLAGTDADGDEGTFSWADTQPVDLVSDGPDRFIARARGGFHFGKDSAYTIPAGTLIATSAGGRLTTGGTWTNASSRALKTGFAAVDPAAMLARVLALEITRWRYTANAAEGEHLGPMAEDFHAAFGLGADATSISTVDATGVALAAIQGLQRKHADEQARIAQRIAAIEAQLAGTRP